MPLCYFAPHKKNTLLIKGDGEVISEFREMVNALHKEDIKVCLDVVWHNHTGKLRYTITIKKMLTFFLCFD